MRGCVIVAFLLAANALLLPVLGQAPGTPPGAPPAGAPAAPPPAPQAEIDPNLAAQRLDEILDSWQGFNQQIENLMARFIARKVYKNLQGQVKQFDGAAKFLKLPGGTFGANIYLHEFDARGQYKQDCYEKFVYTGGALYMFDPIGKLLLVHNLPPPPPGQKMEDGPMPFSIFLLKKQDARKRFDLRVSKIDQFFTYLEVRPKFPADQQEFMYARLVVMNQAFDGKSGGRPVKIPKNMLKELFWVEPNKAEVQWDIFLIEPNSAHVARQDVAPPETPSGWKRENYRPPQAGQNPEGPTPGQPTSRTIR